MSDVKVGIIGLGAMGGNMAVNLVQKFPSLQVYDIVPENVQRVLTAAPSATAAASVKELAAACNVIITMLPATQHVAGVLRGPDGVFQNAPPSSLLIDCSTIDPGTSTVLNGEASAASHRMIDAPVSGGVAGATAGTLTFMVGGDQAVFEESKEILSAMGKNMVHVGAAGTGGVTKLCNNLGLAIHMVGTAEAMNLGQKLGMDPKVLAGVLNTSTGRCWSSEVNNPCPGALEGVPASRGYTGGFASVLMLKDLGLALDAAATVGPDTLPIGSSVHGIYTNLVKNGYGGQDFSVVFDPLSKTGLKTQEQIELAQLREENARLIVELAAFRSHQ